MSEALQLSPAAKAYARTAVKLVRNGERINFAEVARRHGVARQSVQQILSDADVVQWIESKGEEQSDKAGAELRRLTRLGERVQSQLLAIYEERNEDGSPKRFQANELAAIAKLASDLRLGAIQAREALGQSTEDSISQADIDRQKEQDRFTLHRFMVKAIRRPDWGVAVVRLIERLHGFEAAEVDGG